MSIETLFEIGNELTSPKSTEVNLKNIKIKKIFSRSIIHIANLICIDSLRIHYQ